MQNKEQKIRDILFDIKVKGVSNFTPTEATEVLAELKDFVTQDEKLKNEIKQVTFQLEGQAKLSMSAFDDYQKRQKIIDLILRLNKKSRELFIQKGLDAFVLVQDETQKQYLEEINLVLNSMEKKPSLDEVVDMFKE